MSRHALLAVGLLLALPAPASATHGGCRWGATADVDPESSDPVRVSVQPAFWFCHGPVVAVRVGSRGPAPSPPAPTAASAPPPLRLALSPRSIRAGRTARVRVRALWIGPPDEPAAGVDVRIAGRVVRTGSEGTALLRVRPRRRGRIRAVAGEATATVRVVSARSRSRATRG